jgi:ABC-type sugar transport system ATPase subunit
MEAALVEPVGGEKLVTFEREGVRIVARLAGPERVEVGQTVELGVDMHQAHLFDRSSGLAIGSSRPDG